MADRAGPVALRNRIGSAATARTATTTATATRRGGPTGTTAPGNGDCGQKLHGVGMALRTGGRIGGRPHRAADLEGVAASAAAVVITRHPHSVGPSSDKQAPANAGPLRVGSGTWRTGMTIDRLPLRRESRHRIATGRSAAPAQPRNPQALRRLRPLPPKPRPARLRTTAPRTLTAPLRPTAPLQLTAPLRLTALQTLPALTAV